MKSLEEILQYNEKFVEEKKYEEFVAGKFPKQKDGNYFLYGYKTC